MDKMTPMMTAWQVTALGQAPVQVRLAVPVPGPGEVLVAVAAAGLNFADLLMQDGTYQDRAPVPFVPGMELAGTVLALGPGVAGPPPGTRVAAVVGRGAFAQRVVVAADRLAVLPDGMDLATAAGFQITHGTAHLALARAGLRAGETVFVTGAAGGAGLTAVQVAHLMGARVIGQARGADKAARVRAAGAEQVIDSDAPDLKDALRALGGIDVTYDTVGGSGFDAALRATRPGGRMLSIGFAGGEVPKVALNQLLVRNVSVIGFWFGGLDPVVQRDSLQVLLGWWQQGRLDLAVETLPFDALPEGHARLRARTAVGKLVLTMPAPADAAPHRPAG